jgi:hypothetical protein
VVPSAAQRTGRRLIALVQVPHEALCDRQIEVAQGTQLKVTVLAGKWNVLSRALQVLGGTAVRDEGDRIRGGELYLYTRVGTA